MKGVYQATKEELQNKSKRAPEERRIDFWSFLYFQQLQFWYILNSVKPFVFDGMVLFVF